LELIEQNSTLKVGEGINVKFTELDQNRQLRPRSGSRIEPASLKIRYELRLLGICGVDVACRFFQPMLKGRAFCEINAMFTMERFGIDSVTIEPSNKLIIY
jgi:hypothetical protein